MPPNAETASQGRPAPVLAEASLHPELLPALARAIARAAERSQVWIVTHSTILARAIAEETGIHPRRVIRQDGATWLDKLSDIGVFADE